MIAPAAVGWHHQWVSLARQCCDHSTVRVSLQCLGQWNSHQILTNTGPVDSTILNCWPQQQQTLEAIMTDSEMSPKAKVTYDQHKFEVEFNVTEYLPEVSVSYNFHLKLSNIFVISALRYLNCLRHLWLQHYLCSSVTWWYHLLKLVIKMLQFI